jgi:hypothetical protein
VQHRKNVKHMNEEEKKAAADAQAKADAGGHQNPLA